MAFFDELSKTLSDKGREAAQKAKEAAGILQTKAQIASEKSKLRELYGAVGVLYYKKHRDDEENEFQDLFREIGNVLTNVAAMEEKLQEMEGMHACPNCKKMAKKDAVFCSYCGTLLKKEEDETEEQAEGLEKEDAAEEDAGIELEFVEEEDEIQVIPFEDEDYPV